MDELRKLWRKLDDGGMDWISAWDHFYESPPKTSEEPHFEALATLGALAAETRHARIGCLVFYVGYRNPTLLAKAATTLDHITGGRFEIGPRRRLAHLGGNRLRLRLPGHRHPAGHA